ncbi:hypothetical protein CI610_03619 [invertebrate metagenome]|uniref:Uncharacterized protein n=1 Tax=invertebrate metagenome TaxID=1711999 RepID=A0A2H9T2L3_9ZZZZ
MTSPDYSYCTNIVSRVLFQLDVGVQGISREIHDTYSEPYSLLRLGKTKDQIQCMMHVLEMLVCIPHDKICGSCNEVYDDEIKHLVTRCQPTGVNKGQFSY